MASRIRILMGWSLLAVYGGLALLGHAGMHALEGSHAHAPADHVADAHAHSHDHGGCHHHPHSSVGGDTAECPGEQDGHHHHHDGQGHDHDNCLICHHFGAKAALIAVAAPLTLASGLEHVACIGCATPPAASRYVLPIRGPPAGDC